MVAGDVGTHLHAPLWVTLEGSGPGALQKQRQEGLAWEEDAAPSALHIMLKLPIVKERRAALLK